MVQPLLRALQVAGPEDAATEKLAADFLLPYLPARVAEYPNTVLTHAEAVDTSDKCFRVRCLLLPAGCAYVLLTWSAG